MSFKQNARDMIFKMENEKLPLKKICYKKKKLFWFFNSAGEVDT